MSKTRNFLVVSYDDGEQQWFWDFVAADSEESAEALVCARRPYVLGADAVEPRELKKMAQKLGSRSPKEVQKQFSWLTKDDAPAEEGVNDNG